MGLRVSSLFLRRCDVGSALDNGVALRLFWRGADGGYGRSVGLAYARDGLWVHDGDHRRIPADRGAEVDANADDHGMAAGEYFWAVGRWEDRDGCGHGDPLL